MDGSRTFRNHPEVILDNIIVALFTSLVFVLTIATNGASFLELLLPIVLIVGITAAISAVIWKKTLYTFDETELVISRTTLFRTEKHIQYTKLASVGVTRSIVNRVFGTTCLTFNVNSSVNAQSSEAKLVLKKDMADALRDELNRRIFSKDMSTEADCAVPTMIGVSNMDVVLNSFIGQPTAQALFGLLMTAYTVFTFVTDRQGAFVTAFIILFLGEILPIVSQILRYFNYRIYRVDDTITVESGMLSRVRMSFQVNRINSVRIREPLLARMIGKAVLEAEVVGLATDMNKAVPVLCPLKARGDVCNLMFMLVPEIAFDADGITQPRSALVPMVLKDIIAAAVCIIAALATIRSHGLLSAEFGSDAADLAVLVMAVACAFVAVAFFIHTALAQKNRSYCMGGESFMLVYGGYDKVEEYMLYDKVQYTSLDSGIVARRMGLSRCRFFMMSSIGMQSIRSGYFPSGVLESISSEVVERIRDGRYDYRKYI